VAIGVLAGKALGRLATPRWPGGLDRASMGGYAWESADTGEEVTPTVLTRPDGTSIRVLTGEQEHHVSADVAYAVWQYWQASGDDRFFTDAGAEILLETARFWASRGQVEADGRYHIRKVIGPDQYHESVDDDAFTNGMAQWNLERGAEAARILGERWPARGRELSGRLGLEAAEVAGFADLAAKMASRFDPRTGLYEQFEGYFGLADVDLDTYAGRAAAMDVLLGQERVRATRIVKQADVVLLMYLLWDRFPPGVREANFRYYEPRTDHGSSLSPPIHALVAARLGDVALAERYFHRTVEIDLADTMGNASGGVHAAALGGLWQAAVFGFAGLTLRPDGIELDPHLPPSWRRLGFPIEWRGRAMWVDARAEAPRIEVRLRS
jgi:kojibiose phosphorylase